MLSRILSGSILVLFSVLSRGVEKVPFRDLCHYSLGDINYLKTCGSSVQSPRCYLQLNVNSGGTDCVHCGMRAVAEFSQVGGGCVLRFPGRESPWNFQ